MNPFIHVPSYKEAYQIAADDAGIKLVATGKKESDFQRRGCNIRAGREAGWHPIRKWRKADVLGYCKEHGIVPPPQHADAGGIDLTVASLRWLKANYPGDYAKLLEWFPHAEAAVLRAEILEARKAEAETH